MKEHIDAFDCAGLITKELPHGILLNTMGAKFNSMVIGWGHIGVIWGVPAFIVYVRQSRYTRLQLDSTREFTVSAPAEGHLDREVFRVCGSLSGRDVDKEKEARLTLVQADMVLAPAVLEYPVTLECRVLYRQDQCLEAVPEDITRRFYARGGDEGDFHTAYIGQIVGSYVLR